MLLRSLGIGLLAIGLAAPAFAQQSNMHRYVGFFKYSDQAIKAMTENPQDRSAQAAKLAETFGGTMESIYWMPTGGQYDGFVVWQLPDDVTAEALLMMTRATGNFAVNHVESLMTGAEYKAAMEKTKEAKVRTGWTPPTATTSTGSSTPPAK